VLDSRALRPDTLTGVLASFPSFLQNVGIVFITGYGRILPPAFSDYSHPPTLNSVCRSEHNAPGCSFYLRTNSDRFDFEISLHIDIYAIYSILIQNKCTDIQSKFSTTKIQFG
jgi:hypothetical protein